jgi:hypothetical protein
MKTLRAYDLGLAAKSHGPEKFALYLASDDGEAKKIRDEIKTEKFDNVDSLRSLFTSLTGINPDDPDAIQRYAEHLRRIGEQMKTAVDSGAIKLAASTAPVTSGTFPYLLGQILTNALNPVICDSKTPIKNTFQTVSQMVAEESYGRTGDLPAAQSVGEGEDYTYVQFGEEMMKAVTQKYGALCALTMETIRRDRLGLVIKRAGDLVKIFARQQEYMCAMAISDNGWTRKNITRYAYYPEGSRVALYRTSAGSTKYDYAVNKKVSNALATLATLVAARVVLDAIKDSLDRRIDHGGSPLTLIVPSTLQDMGEKLAQPFVLLDMVAAVDQIQRGAPPWLRGIQLAVSEHLDAIATVGVSTWYLGYPSQGFIWAEFQPLFARMETFSDEMIKKDVVSAVKVGFEGGAACIDDRHVVCNISAGS